MTIKVTKRVANAENGRRTFVAQLLKPGESGRDWVSFERGSVGDWEMGDWTLLLTIFKAVRVLSTRVSCSGSRRMCWPV